MCANLVSDVTYHDEYAKLELQEGTTVVEAAKTLIEKEEKYLILTDSEEKIIGMVSDRNLLAKVLAEGKPADTPLKEVLDKPDSVKVSHEIDAVLQLLSETGFPCVPVVDDEEKLIGVVTLEDCLGLTETFDLDGDVE